MHSILVLEICSFVCSNFLILHIGSMYSCQLFPVFFPSCWLWHSSTPLVSLSRLVCWEGEGEGLISLMPVGACLGEGNSDQGVYVNDGFEAVDPLVILVS
jgi:hypothetical protein